MNAKTIMLTMCLGTGFLTACQSGSSETSSAAGSIATGDVQATTGTQVPATESQMPTKILTKAASLNVLRLDPAQLKTFKAMSIRSSVKTRSQVYAALGGQSKALSALAEVPNNEAMLSVGDSFVPTSVYESLIEYTPYNISQEVFELMTTQEREFVLNSSADELTQALEKEGLSVSDVRSLTYTDHSLSVDDVKALAQKADAADARVGTEGVTAQATGHFIRALAERTVQHVELTGSQK
jgi:hypothetical protein